MPVQKNNTFYNNCVKTHNCQIQTNLIWISLSFVDVEKLPVWFIKCEKATITLLAALFHYKSHWLISMCLFLQTGKFLDLSLALYINMFDY